MTIKTVKLEDGKYQFDVDEKTGLMMAARRHGGEWPTAFNDWRFSKCFMAALNRIIELEGQVPMLADASGDRTLLVGAAPGEDELEKEWCGFCRILSVNPCDSPPVDICEQAINETYGDPTNPRTLNPGAIADAMLARTADMLFGQNKAGCTLGVGCDEAGNCFAMAHGKPEECGAPTSLTDADINDLTMDKVGKWPSFHAQSWAWKVVHAVLGALPANGQVHIDAQRYHKLRRWMSSNVPEGWREVCNLASVAVYVDWNESNLYLDSLPECNVGLCEVASGVKS